MTDASIYSTADIIRRVVGTTTTIGAHPLHHTYGGHTVEPTTKDEIQLLAVQLAGTPQYLAWPNVPEMLANVRITSTYVHIVEINDDFVTHAGDAIEFSASSAAVVRTPGVSFVHPRTARRPRTDRGKRLLRLRQQVIASGVSLLDWDDLEKEVQTRRAERRT